MHLFEEFMIKERSEPIRRKAQGDVLELKDQLEEYSWYVGSSMTQLSTSIEKAKLTLEYLSLVYQKDFSKSSYSLTEHVEYFIEDFFIRSSSIYDRALIFANHLHYLGIDNESISHKSLVTNSRERS